MDLASGSAATAVTGFHLDGAAAGFLSAAAGFSGSDERLLSVVSVDDCRLRRLSLAGELRDNDR